MPIVMAAGRQKKKPLSEICTEDATTTNKTIQRSAFGFFFVVCGDSLRKARL